MRPFRLFIAAASYPVKNSLSSSTIPVFFHSTFSFISPSNRPPSSYSVLFSLCRGVSHSSDSRSPIMAAPPRSTTPPIGRAAGTGGGRQVGISRSSWIKARTESILAMYTPFVICLAAGNLKLETFRDYIAQDVHFLRAFAQAYELAEDFADDDDDKVAISELRKSVLDELKMHDSFVQEWGFDSVKDIPKTSATVKYTDFLLATASGKIDGVKGPAKLATPFEKTKIAAYTLGAMTPCMRLYAFIGKELQELLHPDDSNHRYKKWINTYSSDGFQASTQRTEDLLDKLSVSLTGEELDIIQKLYLQAMRLEIEFFAAQLMVQPAVIPLSKELKPPDWHLMFFSDFDLTCTVVDSSAILAEIAIVTAPKPDKNQPENQILRLSSVDLRNTWEDLSKKYTEEHERCIESILSTEKAEQVNFETLCKALEQLSDFEKKANARVIESAVLKGLHLEDIKKAGERLILQDGCPSFFRKMLQKEDLNVDVHVLSYCWCSDLIKSAFSSGGLNVVNVHANEFTYEESVSTGEIVKKVESPLDKVESFNDIVQKSSDEKKRLTVYVGDSVGDLLCLLKADVGIVIGSSASLKRVGSHFGVSFVPLFEGLVSRQKEFTGESGLNWKGSSGVLYTVSSWAEIYAFILGS